MERPQRRGCSLAHNRLGKMDFNLILVQWERQGPPSVAGEEGEGIQSPIRPLKTQQRLGLCLDK